MPLDTSRQDSRQAQTDSLQTDSCHSTDSSSHHSRLRLSLSHATRLIQVHTTSSGAAQASQALGREERIAERARRREFVTIIKVHIATVRAEGCNYKECDGPN